MAVSDMRYADSLYRVSVETPEGTVELVGASYAGIPFFVESADVSGGRSVVSKPLPFSDAHVNEDTGKKVREFPFSFYLLGADVEIQRERLEEAFEREGAFELVHPYYGKFLARCSSYGISHSRDASEYVTGSATFVPESSVKNAARAVEDLRGVAIEKSEATLSAAEARFAGVFSIAGKAKGVVDSVVDFTETLLSDIDACRASLRSVSAFVNEISEIRENCQLALMSPSDFAARIRNLLTMTSETAKPSDYNGYVNESLAVMAGFRSADSADVSADELSLEAERLALVCAAAMAVRSVVECEFASVEEAREMQDAVYGAFEAAAERLMDSEGYTELLDMEAAALKYLRNTMSRLASVVSLPLSANRDILSVCFDCYGNLSRISDIIDRNGIFDPMFITRKSLRVLSK